MRLDMPIGILTYDLTDKLLIDARFHSFCSKSFILHDPRHPPELMYDRD
jgi:hypothetical protein